MMSDRENQDHIAQMGLDESPLAPVEGIPDGPDRGQRHHPHQDKAQYTKQTDEFSPPVHPLSGGVQNKVRSEGRISGNGHRSLVVPGVVIVRGKHNNGHYSVQRDHEESDQTQLFPELEPGVQKLREATVLRAVVDL